MNQEKLTKDVRFLKIYAFIMTILCGIFLFSAFAVSKNARADLSLLYGITTAFEPA